MKHRNTFFAGLSLAVAVAAIAGGAIVSSNAMAAADPVQETTTVQVVHVGTAEIAPILCTFDVDLPSLTSVQPTEMAPAPGGGVITITNSIGTGGQGTAGTAGGSVAVVSVGDTDGTPPGESQVIEVSTGTGTAGVPVDAVPVDAVPVDGAR